MENWSIIESNNPYVIQLSLPETPKENFKKGTASGNKSNTKLLKIITANSMILENVSVLVVEIEQNQGNKKKISLVTLDITKYYQYSNHQNIWIKFLSDPSKLEKILCTDSIHTDRVQKLLVRIEGCNKDVIIFKEHFLGLINSNKEWNIFAERKLEKRDALKSLEPSVQKFWNEKNIFQPDAKPGVPKWIGTFPYPYMNGALHLGHFFTITKIDFQAGYQKLKGKNVLFPFAFHCTGMPIKACADKLKREIEHEHDQHENLTFRTKTNPTQNIMVKRDNRRVSAKTAQKDSGSKSQWSIMESLGIPKDEIPKFTDAQYWLKYFPSCAMKDLKNSATKIDWRRSFITTDANPYYDSFVRWQMNRLKKMGKIKFGKRPTIYSPFDEQPCLDHERQTGEKLGVSEYTIIKMEVLKPFPNCLKYLEEQYQKIYVAATTLRPETLYGQTNCWILPQEKYGAYQVSETDVFILMPKAARNLAFQGWSIVPQMEKELCIFEGTQLVGTKLNAPLSKYPEIYVLPMTSIDDNIITTGLYTSVPSDSPNDYIAYQDLKSKQPMCEKYGITGRMLNNEPVPIIEIPKIGNLSAKTIIQEFGIKSPNDHELLKRAEDKYHLKKFNDGIMVVGDYDGQTVQVARSLVRDLLIKKNLACTYYEPEGEVIYRYGDNCVVA